MSVGSRLHSNPQPVQTTQRWANRLVRALLNSIFRVD